MPIDPEKPKPQPAPRPDPTQEQLEAEWMRAALHTIATVPANEAKYSKANYVSLQRALWGHGEEFGMKIIAQLTKLAAADPDKYFKPDELQAMASATKARHNMGVKKGSTSEIVDTVVPALIVLPTHPKFAEISAMLAE